MITAHTITTARGTLTLEHEYDGLWHIAEVVTGATGIARVIDWYMEGFDTARVTFALLAAHPSEVG